MVILTIDWNSGVPATKHSLHLLIYNLEFCGVLNVQCT